MQSITTTKTIQPDQKLIKAKEKFIKKLQDALRKEQELSTVFIGKTKVGGQPSNKTPTIFKNGTGKTDLLDRFIKNVDEAYKTSINKTVLADMLVEAERDLKSLKQTKESIQRAKVLTIIYRNGVVKPTTFPSAREQHAYHWELKTFPEKKNMFFRLGASPLTLGFMRTEEPDPATRLAWMREFPHFSIRMKIF